MMCHRRRWSKTLEEVRGSFAPRRQGGSKALILAWFFVATHRADAISERTKAALAAAKARGVKLGVNGAKLAQANRSEAKDRAQSLAPTIEEIREAGIVTVRGIADKLNARKVETPRGGKWHVASVQRVLKRLAA